MLSKSLGVAATLLLHELQFSLKVCDAVKNLLGFDPWVGKIPWRGTWKPTPVFLPGESHEQRSLVGYSPYGHKQSDTTEAT